MCQWYICLVTDYGLVTLKVIFLYVFRPSSFSWAAIINLHWEAPTETQNLCIIFAWSVLTETSRQARSTFQSGFICAASCTVKKMEWKKVRELCETWGSVNSTMKWMPWCVQEFTMALTLSSFLESPAYFWMATVACRLVKQKLH